MLPLVGCEPTTFIMKLALAFWPLYFPLHNFVVDLQSISGVYTYLWSLFHFFFVALNCPGGTVYDPCASPCQPSCGDSNDETNCTDATCIETCRCPDGQILDGDRCVDPSQCGCFLDSGLYYPVSVVVL